MRQSIYPVGGKALVPRGHEVVESIPAESLAMLARNAKSAFLAGGRLLFLLPPISKILSRPCA